jgi:hypothetical protein
MTAKIFETALGIATPWYLAGVDLDAVARTLTIRIDFVAGSRFALPGEAGAHPVHDTVANVSIISTSSSMSATWRSACRA